MNRLLKLPRPNRAAGSGGYILGRPTRDIETGVIDPLSSNGAANDEKIDTASIGGCSGIGAATVYDSNEYNPNSIVIIDDEDDENENRGAAGAATADDDDDDDDDEDAEIIQSGSGTGFGRGLDYAKILKRRRKNESRGSRRIKALTNVSSSTTKMTTRYRFRDLLLGDFSFNDDGER